jgi:ADP-ribose pyrophosphatase
MSEAPQSPTNDSHLVETCIDSTLVHQGKFLQMKRDNVLLPDGTSGYREYLVHPGAVAIIPLLDDGQVLLERQYRYPVGQVMIEFPAGKLDPQEGSLSCAKRELLEETGYTAHTWTYLGKMHPVISYSTEFIDVWVAQGLMAGEQHLDAGEFLEVFKTPLSTLQTWICEGKLSDVKTLVATYWLEKWLAGQWPTARLAP